jgi:hypothetical protein
LLFRKVMDELDRRVKDPFEIINMSFVNYVCARKARRYLMLLEGNK